ncbi:MAG: hypothetical protein D6768_02555 [Chloroflexi bacterium]|nr:MAG: hypothetical protein D6768_02555 [Chloroflexota bacterium]
MGLQIITPQQLNFLSTRHLPTASSGDGGLRSPFLRVLANAGRDLLSQVITEIHAVPGQIIFKEGDNGDAMFIIWSGRVAVVKGDLDSPTVLGYRGAGEIVGEMALLEHAPRSASIVALENVRLLSITREDFETLLTKNPTLGLSILSMLSARLRAADDARKSSQRAETRLTKQVSKLQNEKQQLVELEQLRQDTIDLIVHDLRHPISSLFGAIKILEMVLPEEILKENQQLIDIANSNCDLLQLMVESLLDVAGMDSGDFNLHTSQIDLKSFTADAVNRVQMLANIENISIRTEVAADLPGIRADEEKLHRIMGNLLHNAIKFTPGGGEITVNVSLTGGVVQFAVTDSGPGIPPENRDFVFERFAQLGGEHPRVGGFGLGLAFCKMAVEAHGGQIWVESGELGQGSRFVFTLPVESTEPVDTENRRLLKEFGIELD